MSNIIGITYHTGYKRDLPTKAFLDEVWPKDPDVMKRQMLARRFADERLSQQDRRNSDPANICYKCFIVKAENATCGC